MSAPTLREALERLMLAAAAVDNYEGVPEAVADARAALAAEGTRDVRTGVIGTALAERQRVERASAHVITKARSRNDDTFEVSHYAVGPVRRTAEEAQDDLERFLAAPPASERPDLPEPDPNSPWIYHDREGKPTKMQPMSASEGEPGDGIPRRIRVDKMVPAERAILDAVEAVEVMGADERLTGAVVKLDEARTLVADFVDGVAPAGGTEGGDRARGMSYRRRRELAGLTMGDMADQLGVPVPVVSDMERGKAPITPGARDAYESLPAPPEGE